ncbi:WecB/TagA/CpsF family glycosyltransferase [Coraliomargarita akajimensis]|uniref:Glycosyl transferase, WecB/TagA/CpsF family n=1 Tax=Coraliomargarita akajimensis (strain DSM 45221 / IAM 15411 / JCM 23193 / KCTC 12865 / 04OKA010-24) TaxID=583355 RepID=D5EMM4_CORAD|nr:WecB/TagA/CpsF family glycosyltransferase [Coraliomargarita akajimensis]ADE53430.1 glycosyl transferase, WecB/TagA/CpsF family [Coraliomargarita akajimensis DSM 45221]
MGDSIEERLILGQRVHGTSYADATARVLEWAKSKTSAYVTVANVHVVMEGVDSDEYRSVTNDSDLVTPDGMPLVWSLRMLGIPGASRVYGPDLTLHVCEAAADAGVPIALYGGRQESLDDFIAFLKVRFPKIEVNCAISPPFRPLTEAEDAAYTRQIADSGAGVLFVGIGCPKQERWMAAHKGLLPMPMLGVGAAFDFHSGRVKQSPAWMQKLGLEWLFRFMMEPSRLWKRYVIHNPRFVAFMSWQLAKSKLGRT